MICRFKSAKAKRALGSLSDETKEERKQHAKVPLCLPLSFLSVTVTEPGVCDCGWCRIWPKSASFGVHYPNGCATIERPSVTTTGQTFAR